MFESLEDTMKHDDKQQTTAKERWMRLALTAVISVVVVGGLLMSIRMLE
jgi:hypothetical protein